MILTIMGLTPGPLVRVLLPCILTIPFVVIVAWIKSFCSNRSRFQLWCYCVCCVCTNRSWFQRWSTHQNILALKFLIFPLIFKISFIAIVLVWPCRIHSDRCCFAKNMVRYRPMGSIRRPYNPGSRSTKDTEFILCVDDPEPQIHELWCVGLDNITREFYPISQLEVVTGTMGDFTTDYLVEKKHRIPIIGQLSINSSV